MGGFPTRHELCANRVQARAAVAMLLVLAALAAVPSAARGGELFNDSWLSGQPAAFQLGFVAGETAAVRLVPVGPCPCQLDEVRFLFGGAGTTETVTLRVWDDSAGTADPGVELYSTTIQLTGTNDFMQSVDLSSEGITVDGPFRVGLEFTHSGLPSVARDADGLTPDRNFIDAQFFGWVDSAFFGVPGDWIIRAVVDAGASSGPGTLVANDSWIDGQPAAFQGGFEPGEIAAVRLVPPGPCPCRLDRIQFLFGGAGTTHDVTFRVWDDSPGTVEPGVELYSTTVAVTGTQDFMQEVDISAVGLMVDGPIRIGLEFSHTGYPGVARDDDDITPDVNFIYTTTPEWVEASTESLTGDWIIRAVLDAAPGSSGGILLANDSWLSGQVAAFQDGFEPGETAAARFVPGGPCPCPLEKVRFLFGGSGVTENVTLRVWDDAALTDDPGSELYSTTLELTGSNEFMQEVDLGVLGVEVDGPFRVGLEFTHTGLPSVASDANGITADRNFIDDANEGWVESSTKGLTGDWIIRAVLGAEPEPGELVNNDTWVPGQTVSVQAGFEPGEIAAVRFVPDGPCPCELDKLRFLFAGAETSETVTLRVWDDLALTNAPGAELYSTSLQLTGSDLFLQELDLTVAGITVSGPFRVGFEFTHSGPPSVASDGDGITPARNFVYDGSWVDAATLLVSGDFVLRAVLDSLPGSLLAADSYASAAPASFGSGLATGDTAAVRLFPQSPCPCPVEDVRFLLGGAQGTQVVTVKIWDDGALTPNPGTELYAQDVSVAANDQVLQVIDLQDAGVVVNGAFRVGVELHHSGAPSVATDADGLTPGRSFTRASGLWAESSESGDWVIRATLEEEATPVPALPFAAVLLLFALLAAASARRRT